MKNICIIKMYLSERKQKIQNSNGENYQRDRKRRANNQHTQKHQRNSGPI